MVNSIDTFHSTIKPRQSSSLHWLLKEFKLLHENRHLIDGQGWHQGGGASTTVPPFALKFSEDPGRTHLLAIADEDGGVTLCDTNKSGPAVVQKKWCVHRNAIFDLEWVPSQMRLLTASGDQTCQLWDTIAGCSVDVFRGHAASLKAVCSRKTDSFVFATCARDGNIMVFDQRVSRKESSRPAVNCISNAHSALGGTVTALPATKKPRKAMGLPEPTVHGTQQSITSIVFSDENLLVSAGASDGVIKVWDLRRSYRMIKGEPVSAHAFTYAGLSNKKGYSSLVLDDSRTRLFASCTDDIIYQFSCSNYAQRPVACFAGHKNSTFYVKAAVSPGGRFLLSGSSDCKAYAWEIDRPDRSPWVLEGHLEEVTAVAWHPVDMTTVVTASDDDSVCIWRLMRDESDVSSTGSNQSVVGRAHLAADTSHVPIGLRGSTPASGSSMCETWRTPRGSGCRDRVRSSAGGLTPSSSKTLAAPWPSTKNLRLQPKSAMQSPRKLFVSPSKCTVSMLALSSDSDANDGSVVRSAARRRLCGSSAVTSPRMLLGSGDEIASQSTSSAPFCTNAYFASCSNSRLTVSPSRTNVLMASVGSSSQQSCAEPSCGRRRLDLALSSPTCRLPNLALSPQCDGGLQFHSPIESCQPTAGDKENTTRTPDWLTQYRLRKLSDLATNTSPNSTSPPPSADSAFSLATAIIPSGKTPRSRQMVTRKALFSKTPRGPPTMPLSSSTITAFFSPAVRQSTVT